RSTTPREAEAVDERGPRLELGGRDRAERDQHDARGADEAGAALGPHVGAEGRARERRAGASRRELVVADGVRAGVREAEGRRGVRDEGGLLARRLDEVEAHLGEEAREDEPGEARAGADVPPRGG